MPLDPTKIKACREAERLSVEQAAKRADMAPPNWRLYESGRRPDPTLSTVERMAKAVRRKVGSLIT